VGAVLERVPIDRPGAIPATRFRSMTWWPVLVGGAALGAVVVALGARRVSSRP
jgi:hypothetical protein